MTNAWERTVSDVVTITLADKATGQVVQMLTGTLEHPFMTPAGWVGMGALGIGTEIVTRAAVGPTANDRPNSNIGTEIVTRAGPNLVVTSATRKHSDDGISVYNFTVDEQHTYFVGRANGGAWVHNDQCSVSATGENEIVNKSTSESYYTRSKGGQGAPKYYTNGRVYNRELTFDIRTKNDGLYIEGYRQDTEISNMLDHFSGKFDSIELTFDKDNGAALDAALARDPYAAAAAAFETPTGRVLYNKGYTKVQLKRGTTYIFTKP